jgi:hypothetical protein
MLKVVCNTGNDAKTETCAVIYKHSKLRAQKRSQVKVCAVCTGARGRTQVCEKTHAHIHRGVGSAARGLGAIGGQVRPAGPAN